MTPNEQAALDDLVFELTKPHSLDEIADHLGKPKSTIQSIEARALRKMRRMLDGREDWQSGLKEPPPIARRIGETIASNGATTKPWSDEAQ